MKYVAAQVTLRGLQQILVTRDSALHFWLLQLSTNMLEVTILTLNSENVVLLFVCVLRKYQTTQ